MFKKADFALLILFLVLGLGSLGLLRAQASSESVVSVSCDGKAYGSYRLAEDQTVEINSSTGHNTMEIKDGQVWISDADCPNKDCMEFGKISKEGQVILCLPHKLSIKIQGPSEPDAVSY